MVRHGLKQANYAQKSFSLVKLKINSIRKIWGKKMLHSNVKDSLPVNINSRLQFLLPRLAQPVAKFWQDFFTLEQVGFDHVFSLT